MALCHALGHLPDLLLSPSPHTHRHTWQFLLLLRTTWPSFHSFPVLCAFPPQGPGTYFPSAGNDLSSQASLTPRLSHFFRTHPPTKFFTVCGSNQRHSHGDGRISELVLTCAYQESHSFLVLNISMQLNEGWV